MLLEESQAEFRAHYATMTPKEWLGLEKAFQYSNRLLHDNPDKLCVGIRLNVQVNLFLRTLQTCDDGDRVERIGRDTGCFALTERTAGVLSGMHIRTLFEERETEYVIRTVDGDTKEWVSQGMSAKHMLVVAANQEDHRDVRIFCIEDVQKVSTIERRRIYEPNMRITHSLDLASVTFNECTVPKTAVLKRSVGMKRMELLASLYVGRLMIAEGAVASILGLIRHLKTSIKALPMNDRLDDYRQELERIARTIAAERECLLETNDVERVNQWKIKCVERAIEIFNDLALLHTTKVMRYPLKHEDLILMKVAEGDTDVLRLAMVWGVCKKGWHGIVENFGVATGVRLLMCRNRQKYVEKSYRQLSDAIMGGHQHIGW